MAVRAAADVTVGEDLPERVLHVDRATLVQYAGASLDRNPIHWDERFAKKVGLPDVIAHGMWTMGAVSTVVAEWVGDAGRVVEFGTRFTRPVIVPYDSGADLVVGGSVTELDPETRRAKLALTSACGEDKVLGRCTAVVQLD